MTKSQRARNRWFAPVIIVIVIISALVISIFAIIMLMVGNLVLVPSLKFDYSNIAARGIITEIHIDYTTYGLGDSHNQPYHVFPAVIVVNLTEIISVGEHVNGSLDYWKSPHSLGVQFRDIALAYDDSDVPNLKVGQPIEFSGHYAGFTDTVNSFFVTISSRINGSYLKLTDLPLPDSAAPKPQYLKWSPGMILDANETRETRIFLVSATAKYSTYPEDVNPQDPHYPDIHKGDPCIIINVTVRNDYSVENPPVNEPEPSNYNYSLIAFSTHLYDKNGQVSALDVTPPYPNGIHNIAQHGVGYGEIQTIQIYKATDNKDIDHYEIYMQYIHYYPIP